MSAADDLALKTLLDELDEPTRQRVATAKLDSGGNSRLACDGAVNGVTCTDVLYQCEGCKQVGCRAQGCSRRVYDYGNVCVRCGRFAGMNRFVKFTSTRLYQAWRRYYYRPGGDGAGQP